ncbi:hypothetical protein [Azospirillum sp. TSO5]|uniref:hypothetical protein n=1 Tax=Azospirillum sp. TSO5 TaxID=716760 RepID=UPI0011B23C8E|nr:hypothetical protein [Azospirillum sp. TSO5]
MNDLNCVAAVEGEPRVLDTELAAALGMARPTNIRNVIELNNAELEGFGHVALTPCNVTMHDPSAWSALPTPVPLLPNSGGLDGFGVFTRPVKTPASVAELESFGGLGELPTNSDPYYRHGKYREYPAMVAPNKAGIESFEIISVQPINLSKRSRA